MLLDTKKRWGEKGGGAVRISQEMSDAAWARKRRDGQELARSPMVRFFLLGALV